jgi:integrase
LESSLPESLVNLFLKHKEDEMLKKELLGENWYPVKDNKDEDDFVFTQEDGKLIFVHTPSRWFNKFIKRNNLKHITFHGLRHTNTTILINKNIDIVSISHSLGHAKTSTTTDYYAHHLESVERKMADTFDDILQNNKQSGTESGTQRPKLRVVK